MSPAHHNRSASQGKKPLPDHVKASRSALPEPNARNSRPTVVTRKSHGHGHPRGHVHNHSRTTSGIGQTKAGPGLSKRLPPQAEVSRPIVEDDEFADFPQYCATCEKQIATPHNGNVLYCSEACRRKDDKTTTPLLTPSPVISAQSPFGLPTADVLPQRAPTILRPPSNDFSGIFSQADGADTTDDEAERWDTYPHGGASVDYLSQFHNLSLSSSDGQLEAQRAHLQQRPMKTSLSSTTLPSLSTTPGSVASPSSSFNSRPNLTRPRTQHHPWSVGPNVKSIDLVLPISLTAPVTASSPPDGSDEASSLKSSTSTITCRRVPATEGLSFDKRRPSLRSSLEQRRGSLKSLFSHDAMASLPQ